MSTAYRLLAPASHAAPQRKPRELGIYELPDKRQHVVSTVYSDGCSLYPVRAWESYGNAEFWVDEGGRLLRRGVPTQWTVWDLRDTGETASYPKPVLL
jgi:hypothetical protein